MRTTSTVPEMSSRPARSFPDTSARHGIWLIPIAAIAAAIIFTYWMTVPRADTDLAGLADWNTSAAGFTSGILYLLSLSTMILGLTALYGILATGSHRNWALTGLICGVVSLCLIIAAMGAAIIAGAIVADAYLAGNEASGPVFEDLSGGTFGTPVLIVLVLGLIVGLVGAIATGYAIWSARWTPKWSAILFGLGFVLFVTTFPILTHVGALMMAGGIAWIARNITTSHVVTTETDSRASPALAS